MFEDLFGVQPLMRQTARPGPTAVREIVHRAVEAETLCLEDAWELLKVDVQTQPELTELILAGAREKKARRFRDTVFGISPLYVTSICREHCTYCNFRVENSSIEVTRLRLSPDQLRAEVDFLVNRHGLRVVELVYSSDPKLDARAIAGHLRIAADVLEAAGGGVVGLNAAPYAMEDYQILRDAGLDFVVLWQETYDRCRYQELHPVRATPKADYERRIATYECMIVAGVRHIGMGVLSGLAPWREDWLALMAHERYLRAKFGTGAAVLGVPRLKQARGALVQTTSYIPSDREYLLAIAVHNLFAPMTMPFVNTREPWELCVEAARGGGAIFTFNCCTIPGGYTQGTRGYQFPTGDFPADEGVPRLQAEGLSPVMRWSFDRTEAGMW